MIFRLIHFIKTCLDKNWISNQRKVSSVIASARIILLPTVYIYFKFLKIIISHVTYGREFRRKKAIFHNKTSFQFLIFLCELLMSEIGAISLVVWCSHFPAILSLMLLCLRMNLCFLVNRKTLP